MGLTQNGQHSADNFLTCIILTENFHILIKFSLSFVFKGPLNNKSTLVQVMAWHWTGKPIPESIITHIYYHLPLSLKTKSCHNANIVITAGTGGCHYDNLRCHQWWQCWHYDNSVLHPLFGSSNKFITTRVHFCSWLAWSQSGSSADLKLTS